MRSLDARQSVRPAIQVTLVLPPLPTPIEYIKSLPTNPPPRDDLTVEVIFFGEGGDSAGDVLLNTEASAPGLGVKAKL